jgi:hypothetical protein
MVVMPEQARFQFPVRSDAETVAERTELGVVKRAHDFDFRTVKTVFLPVVHAPCEDLA